MTQKKFMSVVRLGHRTTLDVLKEGDNIVIQEKLDGANASFKKDGESLKSFSRNNELGIGNTLGGFYDWVLDNIDINKLEDDMVYFGEWLNPHKVKYPSYNKQFFLYDIYSLKEDKYLDFNHVREFAEINGLNLIPVFYEGLYQSFEHLSEFVGKTLLGGELNGEPTGEGIVVKNSKYVGRDGKQLYVKLVTDKFREVQKQKAPKDPNKALSHEMVFAEQVVTKNRVEKFLYKLVDEGILNEKFGIEDMGLVLKNITPLILEDILEEESDMLGEEYDGKQLHKAVSRYTVKNVKELLNT